MRKIGEINSEPHARAFGDYLLVEGIGNSVEPHEKTWAIWIHEDDQVDDAVARMARYLENPDDAEFAKKTGAKAIRAQEARARKKQRDRVVDVRTNWARRSLIERPGLVTIALMGICAVLFSAFFMGPEVWQPMRRSLMITRSPEPFSWLLGLQDLRHNLPEIFHGQIWRLVTPAFMHANPMEYGTFDLMAMFHIIFNMFWLKDLGSIIEGKRGPALLLALVLLSAAVSNVAQFLVTGPYFWGFSGVNYALFGFVWMRARYDVTSGMSIDQQTVIIMIGWFFLCWFGLIGGVANVAHTGGLVVGLAWGFFGSGYIQRRMRSPF